MNTPPQTTDLLPSGRFPDPPAPKLLAGYELIRRNGCFGLLFELIQLVRLRDGDIHQGHTPRGWFGNR